MQPQAPSGESFFAVASSTASSGAAAAERGQLGGLEQLRPRLRRPLALRRAGGGRLAARLSLAVIVVGIGLLAVFATAGPSPLVSRSGFGMPGWMLGPLHYLFGQPSLGFNALDNAFSAFMVVMVAAYLLVVATVRTLSLRTIVVSIVALHVLLALVPPLQLNDLFNYLGYARLGALHGLNPYVYPIRDESHDPVYLYSTWHDYLDPYGPLFTALTYPIALLPFAGAYWALKLLAVASSLLFLWLVYRCARLLGRDGRYALAFIALNPIYLIYEVGDFHNDCIMLIPALAAIVATLEHRDRRAGAALIAGVFIKFTVVLVAPFLLVAVGDNRRRRAIVIGGAAAAVVLAALSYALFGSHFSNLADQSSIVTPYSVTNLLGDLLGFGGATPTVVHLAELGVIVVMLAWLRRPGRWLEGIGYSTLALVCSLSWLMPWYIVWVLPFAALGAAPRLRRATLAFTVFLVLTFVPYAGPFLSAHGINPMSSPFGQRADAVQARLEGAPSSH
jgi:hypothetical protein